MILYNQVYGYGGKSRKCLGIVVCERRHRLRSLGVGRDDELYCPRRQEIFEWDGGVSCMCISVYLISRSWLVINSSVLFKELARWRHMAHGYHVTCKL